MTVAVGEICVTPATVEGLAETLTLALLDTGAGGGVVVVSGTEVKGTDVTGTGSDVSGIVEFSAGAVLFCVIGTIVGGSEDSDDGGVVVTTGGVVGVTGGISVVVPLPMTDVSTGGVVVGESIGGVVGVVTSVAFEIGVVTIPVELSTGGVVMVGPSVAVSVPFVTGGRTTLVASTGGVVLVGTSVDSVALVTGGGTMSVGDGSGVPMGDGSSVGTTTDPVSVEVGVVSVPFCDGRTADVTSDAMLLTTELMSPRRSVVVVGVG